MGDVDRIGVHATCTEDIAEPTVDFILIARADEGDIEDLQFLTFLERADPDHKILLICRRDHEFLDLQAHKRVRADINHAVGNHQIGDPGIGEGVIVDSLHFVRFGDRQTRQRRAAVEGKVGDLDNFVGERNILEIPVAVEGALVDAP